MDIRQPCHLTRRHFLAQNSLGIGGLALAWLLNQDKLRADPVRPELEQPRFDLTPKQPHFAPRATAMISLFMQGGPSHLDLFDPKPAMARYDGQPFPGTIQYDNAAEASAKVLHSPWKFRRHGQSGIELSELLPHLGEIADDICLIRSMRRSSRWLLDESRRAGPCSAAGSPMGSVRSAGICPLTSSSPIR
jgi:hypothetical protein